MKNTKILATESVHTIHQLIHQVFTHSKERGKNALSELLTYFDPKFTMITQQGIVVGLPQVTQLFNSALGKRPELEIIIKDVMPVFDENGIVTIRYREIHHEYAQTTERLGTAIIDTTGEKLRWLYLHETPVSP
ncbi:hypothetical protein FM037_00790 [Shewanella psychropiezotolerans]|uniref:DUF4440 domain-containing protein n=1 Tax=Shewanella psychropiezotolerans TaxID=2593655 RepID=A0ABX5WV19_9GAMM|nr:MULTISPECIES: hypothetical protein [Shewanella]MPY25357.1 hypothetical protein [Shewanella sp. YLB-07]QDO82027.1 hypothetical protein FM037_00790 [Shewanella psychropiezotolerans]